MSSHLIGYLLIYGWLMMVGYLSGNLFREPVSGNQAQDFESEHPFALRYQPNGSTKQLILLFFPFFRYSDSNDFQRISLLIFFLYDLKHFYIKKREMSLIGENSGSATIVEKKSEYVRKP